MTAIGSHIADLGPMDVGAFFVLAQRLESSGVSLLAGEGFGLSLYCECSDEVRAQTATLADVSATIDRAASGGFWLGYVGYECARELERPLWSKEEERTAPEEPALFLRRFDFVLSLRGGQLVVMATNQGAMARAALLVRQGNSDVTSKPTQLKLAPVDSDLCHRRRIEQALALISAGDLYQVNLARTLVGTITGGPISALLEFGEAKFAAALNFDDVSVTSHSPELFLSLICSADQSLDRQLVTIPIKGTRPRGPSELEDRSLAKELWHDEKERAELTMIVDLERNDLSRVADLGSIRVGTRSIESSSSVHHAAWPVFARLRKDVSPGAMFSVLFPSGSVTGTPKIRAMETIAALETHRRGLYCGAIVRVDPSGITASMAIRTVISNPQGHASMRVGGGIVADSMPEREVAETGWKYAHLCR